MGAGGGHGGRRTNLAKAGADFGWREGAGRSHSDVAVMGIAHLQAEQVDQPQLAGDPGTSGKCVKAIAFLGLQAAARVRAIQQQEAFVVLDRLADQGVCHPVAQTGLGEFFGWHVHGLQGCFSSINAKPEVAARRFNNGFCVQNQISRRELAYHHRPEGRGVCGS